VAEHVGGGVEVLDGEDGLEVVGHVGGDVTRTRRRRPSGRLDIGANWQP
jgi:hypothetical protein